MMGLQTNLIRMMLKGWQRSLVLRLLASFSLALLITFFFGTMVTVQLAQNSLIRQSEAQIERQRKQMQQQVAAEEKKLTESLKPHLVMLAQVSRAPLLHAESAISEASQQANQQIVKQFHSCFDPDSMHTPIDCLELNSRVFMPGAIRVLNNTFITTTINSVLANEDMRGIEVLDWEDQLYIGYISRSDGAVQRLTNRFKPLPSFQVLEMDINEDGEYLGRVLFHYHTGRIDRMRTAAETQIETMERMARENIASQAKQLTRNRFMEAVFFFVILFTAISFVVLRTVIHPLQVLRRSADQLARGQLDQKINTHRQDELGSLAKSFEHMRESIRTHIDELNMLIAALNEAEHLYRTLFDNAGEMIFVSDTNGLLSTFNPACGRLFGTSQEHLSGQSLQTFLANPEDWHAFRSLLMQQEQVRDFPMQFIHCSGVPIDVLISGTRYQPDGKESSMGIQGIVRDVTAQRKAEEERLRLMKIEQAQKAVKVANEAKSAFLANISHEIRTPLNAILGFSDILHTELKDNDASTLIISHVDAIQTSSRTLLGLINDILDLSKAECDHFVLEDHPFSLMELLYEMQTLFTPQTEKCGIKFVVEVSSNLPNKVILDKNRLRQILINLLGNAVKFTKQGQILLRCETAIASMKMDGDENVDIIEQIGQSNSSWTMEPNGENGMSASDETTNETIDGINDRPTDKTENIDLIILVKDTGPGISESLQASIFEAFVQGTTSGQTHIKGTGLGLAITQQLVTRMNGDITLSSREGEGSCFEVRFKGVGVARGKGDQKAETVEDPAEDTLQITPRQGLHFQKDQQKLQHPEFEPLSHPVDTFTTADWALPENLETFRLKLLNEQSTVTALQDQMIIDDIEKFALKMQSFGETFHYPPLQRWAEQLLDGSRCFDIEKITDTLLGFDAILNPLLE